MPVAHQLAVHAEIGKRQHRPAGRFSRASRMTLMPAVDACLVVLAPGVLVSSSRTLGEAALRRRQVACRIRHRAPSVRHPRQPAVDISCVVSADSPVGDADLSVCPSTC